MPRRGFSLLELLLVLTLVALVTSVVVVRLGTTQSRAFTEHTIARLEATDAQTRTRSRRHRQTSDRELQIGGNSITRFLSAERSVSAGRAVVRYAPSGKSPTYALEIDKRVWLLFAGETGQVTRLEREADVEQVFEALGSHAH